MADLAYLRTRLEAVDLQILAKDAELTTRTKELRERPEDAILLADRDRLVKDLEHLYIRQRSLEATLSAPLPAATALAPGLGSADGAGTAGAANQGAVPLLRTEGPSADAPAPGLKDRFLGLVVAFMHVMCVGVVLALVAKWVLNNNAANRLISTYASMMLTIHSVVA